MPPDLRHIHPGGVDVAPLDDHPSRDAGPVGEIDEPVERAQKGALAAAGGADDGRDPAPRDIHADVLEGLLGAVEDVQPLHPYVGFRVHRMLLSHHVPEYRWPNRRAAALIARMSAVSTRAEAYALACTSGNGVPSWKKIASGSVAAGRNSETGIESVKPAVKSTDAASPIPPHRNQHGGDEAGEGLAHDDLQRRLQARRPIA